jgi:subtilisin
MTRTHLQDAVDRAGAAPATVFLDTRSVAASSDASGVELKLGDNGRMTRIAPAVRADVLADLAQHFVSPDARSDTELNMGGSDRARKMIHLPFLGAVHGVIDRQGFDRLTEHDAVDSLHHAPDLDMIRPVAMADVDEPPPGETWGLQFIKAAELWNRGFTGRGIVVAHLDSGVDAQHAALRGSVEKVADFDLDGNPVQPPSPYQGLDDHGTHTAGTIAGRRLEGAPIIGMAPDVELVDATIAGHGASTTRVIAGIDWALGKGARVMSLSVGSLTRDESYQPVIRKLREQQLLPVVAIGNDGPGKTRCPGNLEAVLSVGSVDDQGIVAPDSSSAIPGDGAAVGPVLSAPGVRVLSAKRFGGYFESSGTSMATPHVAGLAALLFSAKPLATIDEVEQAIIRSCRNPKAQPAQRIGAGIPDAVAALEILLGQ